MSDMLAVHSREDFRGWVSLASSARPQYNRFESEIAMSRIFVALTTLLVTFATSQTAMAGSLENAMDAYVKGLQLGDIDTLNEVFLSNGQICNHREAEIKCSFFAQVLPAWVKDPDPEARGKIQSKEVAGQSMARVTYELQFNGKTYIDYLLLYKLDDRWVVVAKTTLVEGTSD